MVRVVVGPWLTNDEVNLSDNFGAVSEGVLRFTRDLMAQGPNGYCLNDGTRVVRVSLFTWSLSKCRHPSSFSNSHGKWHTVLSFENKFLCFFRLAMECIFQSSDVLESVPAGMLQHCVLSMLTHFSGPTQLVP